MQASLLVSSGSVLQPVAPSKLNIVVKPASSSTKLSTLSQENIPLMESKSNKATTNVPTGNSYFCKQSRLCCLFLSTSGFGSLLLQN
jgi:hypothetical protein